MVNGIADSAISLNVTILEEVYIFRVLKDTGVVLIMVDNKLISDDSSHLPGNKDIRKILEAAGFRAIIALNQK